MGVVNQLEEERAAAPWFDPAEDRKCARREGWIIFGVLAVFAALLTISFTVAPWLAGIIIGAVMYFVPAMLAGMNGHRNLSAITMLNLLLGWTVIGWIVALVWACTKERRVV